VAEKSQKKSCSSLLQTSQMLFEMTLLKFDTSYLTKAATFLGPFCFSCIRLFINVFIDFRKCLTRSFKGRYQLCTA
jgi:hypothetical protein